MTVKQRQEQAEARMLSPYAAQSARSRGREHPMDPCDLRTDFQRDRDRILHCKAFRRLKYKTQVFLSPQGDHFRTRMTHTLEVSQIARTIARSLQLNEDLTEAIALGHDLGHTPFGHMGERALDRVTPGGFSHNAQSLRVVELLEQGGEGLNLTWEVRNGIRYHSGSKKPDTLEGEAVHMADRIAYINHDIDDSIRAGMLSERELPAECVKVLGATRGQRIDRMVHDIVEHSEDAAQLTMSAEVGEAALALRQFMFERVYRGDWALKEEKKADHIVCALFEYYLEHPVEMPNELVETAYREGIYRAVGDYIAGMTDRFAVGAYQRLFIPGPFAGGNA